MKRAKNNKKYIVLYAFAVFLGLQSCQNKPNDIKQAKEENILSYVNPFIGTGGHGHTFPGATTPFGMIQLSPVNGISGWDWCSGYHYSDNTVIGFGHLSLSGTGIGDLNDVLVMPATKTYDLQALSVGKKDQYFEEAQQFRDVIPYKSLYSHTNEKASPGYYKVYLETPKVEAELTASPYTGLHKYSFEANDEQSVIINLGYAINWDNPTEMHLEKYEGTLADMPQNSIITGHRFSTGWAKNQKVFFAMAFSKPIKTISVGKKDKQIASGQVFFDNQEKELLVKVAVSSVSVENALENLKADGNGFNFAQMRQNAEHLWQKELSAIRITTPTDSLKTIFYTALYHTKIAPVTFSDKNGQFRQQNDSIYTKTNKTYSTLSLWDTFRAQNPLITLLNPSVSSDVVKSMLDYSDILEQKLPIWTLYGNETQCMTGYHSIPVIVEAYKKGIRDFDIEKAYQAMKKTMLGTERGLKEYNQYGYVPHELVDESVTITLEYAYDDWCIAQLAKELGKTDDYNFFMKRSKAYQFLLDKETKFMRGKNVKGDWKLPFDPKYSNHREGTEYTEGNAWQHSWFVPHDVEGFIEQMGGKEVFNVHLEKLFTESSEITGDNVSADISGLIGQYAHGNEPSHHIAYLFNKSEKPERAQYWLDRILQTQYNTTPNGLSGNEDCGQMSAWYVWSSMGLYPMNPSSGEYEIGRPLFEEASIALPNGNHFVIKAPNVSTEHKYIKSALLNGKPLDRTFITDEELKAGGELVLNMGNTPNK